MPEHQHSVAQMTLASSYYTDAAIFEREKEAIFYRSWQYAGHLAQIPERGDYFTLQIADEPLLVIRGEGGAVRCFYNVCRHRAHPLLSDAGNARIIACPYHAWTYRSDGRLKRAPHSEKTAGFDREKMCLTQLRVELLGGFIFINLDPDAAPMAQWYPQMAEQLRDYLPDFDELAPALRVEVEERCNWKVSVENYSECYHCPGNHPTFSSGVIDPKNYRILPQGYCLRHSTVAAPGAQMSYPVDENRPHARDYSSWFLWPGFSFQVYPGNLLNTYIWRPLSVDRTLVYREWFSVGGVSTAVVEQLAAQDRDTTVAEDITLVESVQRGLNSRGYGSGPLVIDPDSGVHSEHTIAALRDWTLEALG